MDHAETAQYEAILHGTAAPDPDAYKAGWAARDADAPFHACPQPHHSVAGLSWRLGWNDRAIIINESL